MHNVAFAEVRRQPRPAPPLKKHKSKGSATLQRLQAVRVRTDAALTIQRCWHRYYTSEARKRRHTAATTIQRAWGGTVLIRNAKRELSFLRWLRARRCKLRAAWRGFTDRLTKRLLWATLTIALAKNVYIWRRRLVHRRRTRHAVRIQRWWRRVLHEGKTRYHMLGCVLLRLELRCESVNRGNLMFEQRSAFLQLTHSAHQSFASIQREAVKRWHAHHRLTPPDEAEAIFAEATSCSAFGQVTFEGAAADPLCEANAPPRVAPRRPSVTQVLTARPHPVPKLPASAREFSISVRRRPRSGRR